MGQYIAQLRIPDGAAVRVERTFESRGHHTIWGKPETLLSFVVACTAIQT